MERWDDLRYLVAVQKAGTMSGAARLLGANVGTVSRRIDRLGSDLGVEPFLKTPEGWRPNPALRGLIEAATDFENRITVELNSRDDKKAKRVIPLRMNCPPLVSSLILFPGLHLLRRDAPELVLTVSHNVFATSLGENDVIIASSLPDRGRLMTRRIGAVRFALYEYEGGETATDWVGLLPEFDDSVPMSLGFSHFKRPPRMRLENLYYTAEAMKTSGLAGPLPELLVKRHGGFKRLGGDAAKGSVDLWVCYHETRRGDPAIEALTSWIDQCFEDFAES